MRGHMRTQDNAPISALATGGDTARLRTLPRAAASMTPAAPETPAAPPAVAEAPPLRETLEVIATRIQDYLDRNGRNLEFRVDDSTGRTVISVRDTHTGELIRQIPNEEALDMAQRLSANSGTLLDEMV
jgi:flagellar protein FlaG